MTAGPTRWSVVRRRYQYPLMALTTREVKKRYAGSLLGVAWTFFQPITLVVVYIFVFAFVLQVDRGGAPRIEFVLFLLAGMLPYLAVADGLQRSCQSIREDKALLELERFPAAVIPASRVLSASLGEAIGLVVVLALGVAYAETPGMAVVALPALMLLRLLLTIVMSWIVSALSLFLAELSEVLSLLLTALLFLTPVFYEPAAVPAALRWTLTANPLHLLVSAYRAVLLDGRLPVFEVAWLAMGIAGAGVLAWLFFHRAVGRARDLL